MECYIYYDEVSFYGTQNMINNPKQDSGRLFSIVNDISCYGVCIVICSDLWMYGQGWDYASSACNLYANASFCTKFRKPALLQKANYI